MRSPLGKRVRQRFAHQMRELLPLFKEIPTDGIPPGCRLYASCTNSELTFYIQLMISSKYDSFTIEVAWSEQGVYPGVRGVALMTDQPCDGALTCFYDSSGFC